MVIVSWSLLFYYHVHIVCNALLTLFAQIQIHVREESEMVGIEPGKEFSYIERQYILEDYSVIKDILNVSLCSLWRAVSLLSCVI